MKDILKFFVLIFVLFITLLLNNKVTSNISGALDLKSFWTIQNANKTFTIVNQTVPSGVYSALEEDQIIEAVLYSYNDVNTRWIAEDDWTYSTELPIANMDLNATYVLLTFHGLDTIAEIELNNKTIGNTNNMFVRYRFDVKKMIMEAKKKITLKVKFTSAISSALSLSKNYDKKILPECAPEGYNGECHVNLLRKMQASFAWDWGLAAPSMGIWKPVTLEYYESAIIRDVTFSLESLENDWNITIGVHLESGTNAHAINGILAFEIFDVEDVFENVIVNDFTDTRGEYTVYHTVTISKSSVELWWPNGFGAQRLYGLYVKWEDIRANDVKSTRRDQFNDEKVVRVGFRTLELIQENTDDGLSFFFRVNDVDIFMKGSNWIPMSILPEKSYDEDYVRFLLLSARDTHMNMLRVWGGGLYESDYFYKTADEFGILIWHDLMFACSMYPADKGFLETVKVEVGQNVRRIQYHPSVAIWATNNENEVALRQNWYGTNTNFDAYHADYLDLYVKTVRPEIELNDKWRKVLVSSPSNGIKSEQENFIAQNPQDPHYGDVHFYSYTFDGWNPVLYRGGRFISEYGFQSFPSLSSWKRIQGIDDDLSHLINHRQHSPLKNAPILLMIELNLPLPVPDTPDYWRNVIYLSQVSQAMIVKTATDVYRSKRVESGTMGALYWQLNDVWVAPSWSSIEYGGEYKILHHWMKDILAPRTVISYINEFNNLEMYAVRDTLGDVEKWHVSMKFYKWSSFTAVDHKDWDLSMEPNTVAKIEEFNLFEYLKSKKMAPSEHVIQLTLTTAKETLAQDYVFPEKIKHSTNITNSVTKINVVSTNCDNKTGLSIISLEVAVGAPTIFIYLQLNDNITSLKNCQFSKNGYIQFMPIQTVYMDCIDVGCKTKLNGNDINMLAINQLI